MQTAWRAPRFSVFLLFFFVFRCLVFLGGVLGFEAEGLDLFNGFLVLGFKAEGFRVLGFWVVRLGLLRALGLKFRVFGFRHFAFYRLRLRVRRLGPGCRVLQLGLPGPEK